MAEVVSMEELCLVAQRVVTSLGRNISVELNDGGVEIGQVVRIEPGQVENMTILERVLVPGYVVSVIETTYGIRWDEFPWEADWVEVDRYHYLASALQAAFVEYARIEIKGALESTDILRG